MHKSQKKILGIYQNILARINAKAKKCQHPGCELDSINSHLLQRNGVLSYITENSHLIQIKPNDFFKIDKDGFIDFKKVGIKQAISYPLFCNYHDTNVFKSIEKDPIDFFAYNSQLLFSYRSLCAELRKKENSVDVTLAILKSNILTEQLGRQFVNNEQDRLVGTKVGVDDLSMYKQALEKEIESPGNGFNFVTLKLPLYKVSISAVFSYVDSFQNVFERYNNSEPLNTIFANLIPQNDCLYLIIGYKKDKTDKWILDYINRWQNVSLNNVHVLLSDLATRIETWVMAESLYLTIPKRNVELFKKHFVNSIAYSGESLPAFRDETLPGIPEETLPALLAYNT